MKAPKGFWFQVETMHYLSYENRLMLLIFWNSGAKA